MTTLYTPESTEGQMHGPGPHYRVKSTGAKFGSINTEESYFVSMETWRSIDYKRIYQKELERLEKK